MGATTTTAIGPARSGSGLFGRCHIRRFNVGAEIVSKYTSPDDLVTVGNRTLFTIAPGAKVKIVDYSRGEYTSTTPQAEFRHTTFGLPHYEVEVLKPDTVYDTHKYAYVPVGSRYHVDATRIDGRFNVQSKANAIAA